MLFSNKSDPKFQSHCPHQAASCCKRALRVNGKGSPNSMMSLHSGWPPAGIANGTSRKALGQRRGHALGVSRAHSVAVDTQLLNSCKQL